jgi:hypothetical protein
MCRIVWAVVVGLLLLACAGSASSGGWAVERAQLRQRCSASHDVDACLKLCDAGDHVSCLTMAQFLTAERREPGYARRGAQDACYRGNLAEGCRLAAIYWARGDGGAADSHAASSYARTACALKLADGCRLAGDYELRYNEHDARKAAVAYRQGCAGGSSDSCAEVGRLMVRGQGVPPDVPGGLELLREACAHDSGRGCAFLGVYSPANDVAGRAGAFERACAMKVAPACARAGRVTEATDVPRALAAYRRGCELGDARSCASMAALLPAGTAEADAGRARACALGDLDACLGAGARPAVGSPPADFAGFPAGVSVREASEICAAVKGKWSELPPSSGSARHRCARAVEELGLRSAWVTLSFCDARLCAIDVDADRKQNSNDMEEVVATRLEQKLGPAGNEVMPARWPDLWIACNRERYAAAAQSWVWRTTQGGIASRATLRYECDRYAEVYEVRLSFATGTLAARPLPVRDRGDLEF